MFNQAHSGIVRTSETLEMKHLAAGTKHALNKCQVALGDRQPGIPLVLTQAAITKYGRLEGLIKQHLFLTI